MLTHPTHEALRALKLDGMAEVFADLAGTRGQPADGSGRMDRPDARPRKRNA